MPEHRIYRFPQWNETPYKHIILKRETNITSREKVNTVENDKRLDESLSRSRRLISEYILCNPFTLFCTFTFDKEKVSDRKDYKAIKAKLAKFFNYFRNRYDANFRYMIVPELHKDGSVHFHGVITTPVGLCTPLYVPKRDKHGNKRMVRNTMGYMEWPAYSSRFGFFSCSWIRNYTGCALYVSKYMTKELADWFSKNDQIVMHSKGLKRPELVYAQQGDRLPGERQNNDYDDEFCSVGMRDEMDTAKYYVSDDEWLERNLAKLNARPKRTDYSAEQVPIDWELTNAFAGFRSDEFEQTTMRALQHKYN